MLLSCGKPEQHNKLQLIPENGASVYIEGNDFVEGFKVTAVITETNNISDPLIQNFRYDGSEVPFLGSITRDDINGQPATYYNLQFDLVSFDVEKTANGALVSFNSPSINFWNNFEILEGYYYANRHKIHQVNPENIELDLDFEKWNEDNTTQSFTLSLSFNKISISRQNSNGFIPKTQSEAKNHGILMYPVHGQRVLVDESYVTKFNLPEKGKMITFWLENFPNDMVSVAIDAIEQWNRGLPRKLFEAKLNLGPSKKGNRNFNVMTWEEENNGYLGMAGPVYVFANGEIYASEIKINGGIYNNLKNRFAVQREIGKVLLELGILPVESFSTNFDNIFSPFIDLDLLSLSLEDFAALYYRDAIMHEVGHALGLEHNFKASTVIDEGNISSSIMDYATRSIRQGKQTSIGSYDMAAIRWAFWGEEPSEKLISCGSDELETDWQCNTNDFGNSLDYLQKSIKDLTLIFMNYNEIIPEESYQEVMRSFSALIDNYLKIKFLLENDKLAEDFKRIVEPSWNDLWHIEPSHENAIANWEKTKSQFKPYVDCVALHGWNNRFHECFDVRL